MCDYSLETLASRKAQMNETLRVHRFSTGSKGLIGDDPDCPVCVVSGTTLMLSGIPEQFQEVHHVGRVEEATFEQRQTGKYRDGLRLQKTGIFVLLREMPLDVLVTVLTLAETDAPSEDPHGAVATDPIPTDHKRDLVDA